MSSTFQFLYHHPHPLPITLPSQNPTPLTYIHPIKCTSNSTPQPDSFLNPVSETTISSDKFPIEKRRKSEIIRERKEGLVKPEPPNFEIGWKRTKPIPLEKPTGYVIMDFLEKLVELMDREFGSAELLAKVGEIVAEKKLKCSEMKAKWRI